MDIRPSVRCHTYLRGCDGESSMPTKPDTSDPIYNRLLAALPQEEYERILPHLGHVTFKPG